MKSWIKILLCVGLFILAFKIGFGGSYPYSSLDDFKNQVNGNTYIYDGDEGGLWYKIKINGNKVTMYAAVPGMGEWRDDPYTFTCEYSTGRFEDTGKQFYCVKFGMFILACPFEGCELYESQSSKFNDGNLVLLNASESYNYFCAKVDDDYNPWD